MKEGGVVHRAEVYPRVCGGTAREYEDVQGFPGLSPRVRGNLRPAPCARGGPGSIPACAGEPIVTSTATSGWRVYPRVCGGTEMTPAGTPSETGLSPRVRGNLRTGGLSLPARGSIPACAGEPVPDYPHCQIQRVYPRVCGGTGSPLPLPYLAKGLSPRVRGNPHRLAAGALRRGSIPACAGEPASGARAPCGKGVYPRVCGGTLRVAIDDVLAEGLSPRVRGNLSHCAHS